MIARIAAVLAVTITLFTPATAEELEGNYLYKVSTVRAAPGSLSRLLVWMKSLERSDFFRDSGVQTPLLMRHSQGDQWDLLIITPMHSWTAYHTEPATRKRNLATTAHRELLAAGAALIAFDEDHFAYGPQLPVVKKAYDDNAFFHIEMFAAAAGKADELLEQRRMENGYLAATGQKPNMIFRRAAGSDVDVFTIGFHKSLQAFAAPASADDEQKESAAKAAGFKDRSDISFYLRSLISGHHDTLANKVQQNSDSD